MEIENGDLDAKKGHPTAGPHGTRNYGTLWQKLASQLLKNLFYDILLFLSSHFSCM